MQYERGSSGNDVVRRHEDDTDCARSRLDYAVCLDQHLRQVRMPGEDPEDNATTSYEGELLGPRMMTDNGVADTMVWSSSCDPNRAVSMYSDGSQGDLWAYRFRGRRMELLKEAIRPVHMTSMHNAPNAIVLTMDNMVMLLNVNTG